MAAGVLLSSFPVTYLHTYFCLSLGLAEAMSDKPFQIANTGVTPNIFTYKSSLGKGWISQKETLKSHNMWNLDNLMVGSIEGFVYVFLVNDMDILESEAKGRLARL